jgi:hypothetical protein
VPIYLFYVSKASTPKSFEAFELADDEEARCRAPEVLEDHLTCTSVEVCLGGRTVGTLVRDGESILLTRTSADGTKWVAPYQRSQVGKRRANPKVSPTFSTRGQDRDETGPPSSTLLQFPATWPTDQPDKL